MGSDSRTEWQWGLGSDATDQSAHDGADYLRALKRSNQGLPRDPVLTPSNNLRAGEQRRHVRYKCEGSVELSSLESTVRTWATVSDLSRNGCYVEMQATYPVGTTFSLVVETKGIRFQGRGVVRVSYPFLGMGIEFTEVLPAEQARLDELLLMLASYSRSPVVDDSETDIAHIRASMIDISRVKDPMTVLRALINHFQTSSELSIEGFQKILCETEISLEK